MLNTNYSGDFEYLGKNAFQCYLPKFFRPGRETAPVMDMLIYTTKAAPVEIYRMYRK